MRIAEAARRLFQRLFQGGLLHCAVWSYFLLIIALVLLLHLGSDRWWPGTVLAFSPRWVVLLPLAVLAPFALIWRRRLLWVLTATTIFIIGPILGWETPKVWPAQRSALEIRVMTCNIGGGHVEAWQIPLLITRYSPDIVMLQEYSDEFKIDWPDGWLESHFGELIVASHFPLAKVIESENNHPPLQWLPANGLLCRVSTPSGAFAVCNVHLRTPREGLMAVTDRWLIVNPTRSDEINREIEYRDAESQDLHAKLEQVGTPLIVAGDFNMPIESQIYRRHWGWLINAFSERGWGFGYSKSTRVGPFEFGTRIDHQLASPEWEVRDCWLGAEIGSDHVPVIADFTLISRGDAAQ